MKLSFNKRVKGRLYLYSIKKALLFLCALFSILAVTSCRKFIEVDVPTDRITSKTVFLDDATATAAITGLYSKMVTTGPYFTNGGSTLFTGLLSDELTTTLTTDEYLQFQSNVLAIDNSFVLNNFWRPAYELIYQTNTCIEGLEQTSALSVELKKQLLGEAYFIRAFCYWHLINLFGDVPLLLNTDYMTNSKLARTNVSLVNQSILTDLKKAKSLLSATYPTSGKVRANYYSVLALLTRYYLYAKNWDETEKTATEIIQSGLYSQESSLSNVFLTGSKETIWSLQSDQSLINTYEGSLFIPSTNATIKPNYMISNNLLQAFETNDLRRTAWISSKTVQGLVYNYPAKYKVRLNSSKTENYIVFRLSEIYLSRAEARTQLSNFSGALDDLNILRKRANLILLSVANTSDINSAVQKEKRIEMFAEWGQRWFDLKRNNNIDQVLAAVKPGWKSSAALLPIPNAEILSNINLSQNPGYNN